MQEDKQKYKAETLKLTTMLEKTLKELAAIKKEHQRTVTELNEAQRSRDQIIQILKKQVAHEVQQRQRLWAENNQLYMKLSRAEESGSDINLLEGIEQHNQSLRQQPPQAASQSNSEYKRTIAELGAQIETLKAEKEDVLLRAEYESAIEYNKLRSEFYGTQEKLIRMQEQLKQMERSEYKLKAEKRQLESALSGLRNKSEGDRYNGQDNGIRTSTAAQAQLRAEVDKLRQQNEFLKEVKSDLEESASEYETIIGQYRASLDEARMKYDNRELQYLREKNSQRADRDLLRAEIERLKFQSVSRQEYSKKTEDKEAMIRQLEKQLSLVEVQNQELVGQLENSVSNQRQDFASGIELVKKEYLRNLQERDNILAEYKRECERLLNSNDRLEADLALAQSEHSRLKETLIMRQAARDDECIRLQIEYAELRKEKELNEMRTKQQLERLQREVTDMMGFDARNEQFNKELSSFNDKLEAENRLLAEKSEQLNSELTDTIAEKIELASRMESMAAELSAQSLRSQKLSRQLERVREDQESEARSELAAVLNRVRELEKELQRQKSTLSHAQEREKLLTQQLNRERVHGNQQQENCDSLRASCGKQLATVATLQGQIARLNSENERFRLEYHEVLQELSRLNINSQQIKHEILQEKDHQKSTAALMLEISLLKERNQMLLRERDEALDDREYMQQTNEDLQDKLVLIEASLEELKEDHEERMREAGHSDAISMEKFDRIEQELQEVGRSLGTQKAKCSSLEKAVLEKQSEIRQLRGKLEQSKEREEETLKVAALAEKDSQQLRQQLEHAQERILEANSQIGRLKEQLKAGSLHQKSEVEEMSNNFEDRICELELALAMKQAEVDQQVRRVDALLQQKADSDEQAAKSVKEAQRLAVEQSAAFEALSQELKSLKEQKYILQDKVQEQALLVYNLEQSGQQLKSELSSLEFKTSQMLADLEAKEQSHRSMTLKLIDITKVKAELDSKQQLQKSELQTLTDKLRLLQNENRQLRKRLEEQRHKSDSSKEAEQQLAVAEQERRELQGRVAELTEKLSTQRKECSTLAIKSSDLSEKLRELTEANSRLARQTAELEKVVAQLREVHQCKEKEGLQFEKQLRTATTGLNHTNIELERVKLLLSEEKSAKEGLQGRFKALVLENQRILAESSTEKISGHGELIATVAQLRSQNERLHVQMCGMCKQETLDQLTNSYEAELQKERSKTKQLNRDILAARGTIRESQEKLELLKAEHKQQLDELRKATTLDRYREVEKANEEWTKNEVELNRLLESKRQELSEVRDKYRAQIERNHLLVDSTSRQLSAINERNQQQASRIEQLERQLRAKEELASRLLSEKQKQLSSMSAAERDPQRERHPSSQDYSMKLASDKLRAELEQKGKAERRLNEEKKQLKEELFCVKRELQSAQEDLLFERKRNCHLEELYSKYRNVRSISSDTFLNLTKTMAPVQDKGSAQSIQTLSELADKGQDQLCTKVEEEA